MTTDNQTLWMVPCSTDFGDPNGPMKTQFFCLSHPTHEDCFEQAAEYYGENEFGVPTAWTRMERSSARAYHEALAATPDAVRITDEAREWVEEWDRENADGGTGDLFAEAPTVHPPDCLGRPDCGSVMGDATYAAMMESGAL